MEIDSRNVSRSYFWLIWGIYAMVYMTKNCFSAAMASIVVEGVMTKSQVGLITAVFYGVYAPLLGIARRKVAPYLRPTAEVSSARERGAVNGVSTVKLLAVSGFVLLLAAVFWKRFQANSFSNTL